MQCCQLHDALALVEGLDAKTGLFYAGGNTETYAGMLRRFCAEFERHDATIELCLADQNWKAYSTKLHAMKGLFATIGAADLSARAYRLELASKNGDADICQRETLEFLGLMRGFRESLRAALSVPPGEGRIRTPVDSAVLAKKLAELKRACLEGDSDVADGISADLGTLSHGIESDGDLVEICSFADSLDYDRAAERIDSLLQRLGE